MYVHKWQREVYMGNNENAVDQSVFRILSSNGLIGNICCGSMCPPPQERPRLNARARYHAPPFWPAILASPFLISFLYMSQFAN